MIERLEDIDDINQLPNEFSIKCPFCPPYYQNKDDKKKLCISMEKNAYHCWRCGAHGRASILLTQYTSIKKTDLLNFSFNNNNFSSHDPNSELIKSELVAYDAISWKILENGLINAKLYLNNRGISDEEINYYDIRVGKSNTVFRNRILVPTFDNFSNCVYFVARNYADPKNKIRYLNSSDSHKSFYVWNLDKAKENDKLIITEGCFSGISANKSITGTAVATYGKFMSQYQAKIISEKKPSEIIMSLDSDVPEKEVKKNVNLLRMYYTGLITRIYLPEGKDPNDIPTNEYQELIDKRIMI